MPSFLFPILRRLLLLLVLLILRLLPLLSIEHPFGLSPATCTSLARREERRVGAHVACNKDAPVEGHGVVMTIPQCLEPGGDVWASRTGPMPRPVWVVQHPCRRESGMPSDESCQQAPNQHSVSIGAECAEWVTRREQGGGEQVVWIREGGEGG